MPWGVVAGAAITAIGASSASKKAAKSADRATDAQAQSAADAAAIGREQLAWDKEVYQDQKPTRDAASSATLGLMQQQSKLAEQQGRIAQSYDDYNTGTFRPLEKQIVADASGYDTPERRAAAVAEARANVESAYGGSMQGLSRALGRTGQTYGAGRSQALMTDAALAKAGAIAGATTGATRNIEAQGYARMADAANLGRNLPSAQAITAATSTKAGDVAANSGLAAINAGAAGIGAVNQGYMGALSAASTAGSLYGQAGNAYRGVANAGNSALGAFGNSIGGLYGTPVGQNLMSSIGGWLKPAASGGVDPYGYLGGAATAGDFSDERVKKRTGRKIDTRKALEGIEDTPVHTGWMYAPEKGGPDDGDRPHAGPMAADVARHMGDEVSDGRVIDRVSMNGHLIASMQELSKRMHRLEKRS